MTPIWKEFAISRRILTLQKLQSRPCVECRSDRHPYCRDPFNYSLLNFNDIPYKLCSGYCVKWIRAPLEDDDGSHGDLYVRTCSTNLNIGFQVSPVCLRESHTVGRSLCFCNSPKCNSAPLAHTFPLPVTLFLLVAFFTLL
uniref:UPAR/Ly6 domain-containing protein qvr n=1 Tax=Mesocestoides corti TaxID=53468 RepID=A0A5K3FCY1_MESCO